MYTINKHIQFLFFKLSYTLKTIEVPCLLPSIFWESHFLLINICRIRKRRWNSYLCYVHCFNGAVGSLHSTSVLELLIQALLGSLTRTYTSSRCSSMAANISKCNSVKTVQDLHSLRLGANNSGSRSQCLWVNILSLK